MQSLCKVDNPERFDQSGQVDSRGARPVSLTPIDFAGGLRFDAQDIAARWLRFSYLRC